MLCSRFFKLLLVIKTLGKVSLAALGQLNKMMKDNEKVTIPYLLPSPFKFWYFQVDSIAAMLSIFRWNYCVLLLKMSHIPQMAPIRGHHMPSSLHPTQKLIDLASNGFNRTSNLCESQVYTSQGIQTPAYNCQSLPATEKLLKCLLNLIFPIVYYSIRNRF